MAAGLEATTAANDSAYHLTGNPPTPTDLALLSSRTKHKNPLIAIILSTIPAHIANLIVDPNSDPILHDLLTNIAAHINTDTNNDHKNIKTEADTAHYTIEMALSDYTTLHEKIRTQMIAAKFPNIANPSTTVEFMVEGRTYSRLDPHGRLINRS